MFGYIRSLWRAFTYLRKQEDVSWQLRAMARMRHLELLDMCGQTVFQVYGPTGGMLVCYRAYMKRPNIIWPEIVPSQSGNGVYVVNLPPKHFTQWNREEINAAVIASLEVAHV